MSRVLLIASAAYVEPELSAEFGHLPPAFLPLGNRRLFAHQLDSLHGVEGRVLLSIPDDFQPDPADIDLLQRLNVELVRVPAGLSLGQSIIYVINVTASSAGAFAILHGDTLLHGIDLAASDLVSVDDGARPGYGWGYVLEKQGRLELVEGPANGTSPPALSGFFGFSDTTLLVQSVTRASGDFLRGTAAYSQVHPMTSVRAAQWLDFGHASTYHQSRQTVTTEREFNKLVTSRRSISKSGSKPRKIEAEARWFENLPPHLRVYTPAFLGMQGTANSLSYDIEYLHLPTLADLFVFGRLSRQAWERILEACDEFLRCCASHSADTGTAGSRSLYLDKTLQRLETYARATGVSLTEACRLNGGWLPSLERMAQIAASAIPDTPPNGLSLVHGDFCFSNILYDFRAERVRVIDPRGLDAEENFSTVGDLRYDVGKLHHSAVGQYDTIVAGGFQLAQHGPLDLEFEVAETASTRGVRSAFLGRSFAGMRPNEASSHMISVLLFLSMLPLHSDNVPRQTGLLANAMRLFLANDRGFQA
jgi:aminoglycoside phosphotransferase (APT) family kinase protein